MKPTVLVIDDEAEIAKLVEYGLAQDGYDVVIARSEAEFRCMVQDRAIDMLICDLMLPDGSGLTLVKEVRRVSDVGIIILSGKSAETDQVVGLEIGADDYVTKPFRLRELRARVGSVFRRTRGASFGPLLSETGENGAAERTAGITFDGYELREAARLLIAPDGTEIALTSSEFDLLTALLKRRGHVLTRDQIMNSIKGRDWESYDRAVDGLVSRLRRKIPAPKGEAHYIRTVHGIGYTFRG